MKVLHISAYAFRGGCEKNCFHFIKNSPELEHQLLVLGSCGPMSNDWKELGIPVRHLECLDGHMLTFFKKLKECLADCEYDLAVCWSTVRLPLQLHALRKVARKVRVYLGNPVGRSHRVWKDQLLGLLLPAGPDVKLMACSKYVANSHQKLPYYRQFSVDVSLNPVAVPSERVALPVNPSVVKFGMVARLDPIKDHKTIIQGFKHILSTIRRAELHLVGDGVLRQPLEALVRELGVVNSVFFHGDVKDVYAHLSSWSVFVYATTKEEGLGSVVAEAMSVGLPCVLSDLPMLRELAPSNNMVMWFEEGNSESFVDAVLKLCADANMASEMSKNVFQHARLNFGATRFIDDYIRG